MDGPIEESTDPYYEPAYHSTKQKKRKQYEKEDSMKFESLFMPKYQQLEGMSLDQRV